jgi:hypothetical protein
MKLHAYYSKSLFCGAPSVANFIRLVVFYQPWVGRTDQTLAIQGEK